MPDSPEPRREHPSTYFVQDRSNEEELIRLQLQDQMVTAGLGGILPEQNDPTVFQNVLDVACGTGRWLIEAAKTYPTLSSLTGVDVSARFIEYARSQAETQQMSERVRFQIGDALRMLEFPPHSFDLVNHRFGQSYVRLWEWPKLLSEFHRIARAGGTIRLTEPETATTNSSEALTRLCAIIGEIGQRNGASPTADKVGITDELAPMLAKHGFQDIQTRVHFIEYKGDTIEGNHFYENTKHVFRTILPFLHKWTHVPADYEALYQQALHDIQQPDFTATWRIVTAWGINPSR